MRARGTFARLVTTLGRRQCYVNVCGCDSGWRWGTCGRDRAQYTKQQIYLKRFFSHSLNSLSLWNQNMKYFQRHVCVCDLYDTALLGVWGGWGCYNVTSWHDPEREMTDKHGYMTGHMMSQYTHSDTPYLRHTTGYRPARPTTETFVILLLFSCFLMFYIIIHFILS